MWKLIEHMTNLYKIECVNTGDFKVLTKYEFKSMVDMGLIVSDDEVKDIKKAIKDATDFNRLLINRHMPINFPAINNIKNVRPEKSEIKEKLEKELEIVNKILNISPDLNYRFEYMNLKVNILKALQKYE